MKLACILLLISSGSLFAQSISTGIGMSFLRSQNFSFEKPVQLDTGLYYKGVKYTLPKTLRIASEDVSFESYINWNFNRNFYTGFYFQHKTSEVSFSGNDEPGDPEILLKQNTYSLYTGLRFPFRKFKLFAEGGIGAGGFTFSMPSDGWSRFTGDGEAWYAQGGNNAYRKYNTYLNRNNTLLLGYSRVGIDFYLVRLSVRTDFRIGDISNDIGLRNYFSGSYLNIGLNLPHTGLIPLKRIRHADREYSLADDTHSRFEFIFPKAFGYFGWSFGHIPFEAKENLEFWYSDWSVTRKIEVKNPWSCLVTGPRAGFLAAISRNRKLVGGVTFGYQNQLNKPRNSGNLTEYKTVYIGGMPSHVEESYFYIPFKVELYNFGLQAGYRMYLKNDAQFILLPSFEFQHITQNYTSPVYNLYDWKALIPAMGVALAYQSGPLGIYLQVNKPVSELENGAKLKTIPYFNLLIYREFREFF